MADGALMRYDRAFQSLMETVEGLLLRREDWMVGWLAGWRLVVTHGGQLDNGVLC